MSHWFYKDSNKCHNLLVPNMTSPISHQPSSRDKVQFRIFETAFSYNLTTFSLVQLFEMEKIGNTDISEDMTMNILTRI